MGYGIWPLLYWGAKDGTVVRVLSSHQCCPGSNPGVDAIYIVSWGCCWFSPFLWELFLRALQFSPLLKNQHLTSNQVNKEPLCECASSKSYLFIYLFTWEARFTKIWTWIRILYDGKENGIRDRDNRSSGCSVVMKKEQECSIRNQHPSPPPPPNIQAP